MAQLSFRRRREDDPAAGRHRLPDALDRLVELSTATNKPDDVKKWQAEWAKYPMPNDVSPRPVGGK